MNLFRIDPDATTTRGALAVVRLDEGKGYTHVGVLVPVEPEATLRWCFAHNARMTKWIGGPGCGLSTSRGSCETGTALIVRAMEGQR